MVTDRRDFLKLLGLSVSGTLIEPKRIFYSFAATPLIGDTILIHRLGREIHRIWPISGGHKLVYIPREWVLMATDPYRVIGIDVLAGDELVRRVYMPPPEPYFGKIAVKMTAPNYR